MQMTLGPRQQFAFNTIGGATIPLPSGATATVPNISGKQGMMVVKDASYISAAALLATRDEGGKAGGTIATLSADYH
jgi:hypothetical protein